MTPLLTFADMRPDSLAEFAAGCGLEQAEASDASITAAIARLTQRLQDWTNDLYISPPIFVEVDSDGGKILRLPYRTTAISAVTFRLADGTYTASQSATSYRLASSLNAAGDTEIGDFDYLEVVPYSSGFSPTTAGGYPYLWPVGPRIVKVTGTFGWTTPPADAKRALAILVHDHFKPIRADLGRASGYNTTDASITVASQGPETPSGIPRVDEIIARLKRNSYVGVS